MLGKKWYLGLVLICISYFYKFSGYMLFFPPGNCLFISFIQFSTELLLGVLTLCDISLKIFPQFIIFSLCLFFYIKKMKTFLYSNFTIFSPYCFWIFSHSLKNVFPTPGYKGIYIYSLYRILFSFYN